VSLGFCRKSYKWVGYELGTDSRREGSPSQKTGDALTGVSAGAVAVSLAFPFSLTVAIQRVQFGGGRGRIPPLAAWLVAAGSPSYRGAPDREFGIQQ
jgi:hypothetical protein